MHAVHVLTSPRLYEIYKIGTLAHLLIGTLKKCVFLHFVNSRKVYFDAELFADFLTHREVTWLGVDFSKAKFTRSGFQLPQEVLLRYLNDWNMLIISDQKKYDVRMSFRKPIMQYDLSWVTKRNKTLKINYMFLISIIIALFSDSFHGASVRCCHRYCSPHGAEPR